MLHYQCLPIATCPLLPPQPSDLLRQLSIQQLYQLAGETLDTLPTACQNDAVLQYRCLP